MLRSPVTTAAKALHALSSTGAIVQVDASVFVDILTRTDEHPIVIMHSRKRAFGSDYQYLLHYKGLYFYWRRYLL